MRTEPMADYLNAFRYGCPPHGGLGMGLNRVLKEDIVSGLQPPETRLTSEIAVA